jgi:hypothetical protein
MSGLVVSLPPRVEVGFLSVSSILALLARRLVITRRSSARSARLEPWPARRSTTS